jgi:Helix-turn-helix domain of resolvase
VVRGGLHAGRQRLGRPPSLTAEQVRQARALLTRPENSVAAIARLLGVSRSTRCTHIPDLAGGRWPAIEALQPMRPTGET